MTAPTPIADRFWKHVDTSGDCWTWTAYRNVYGYGVVGVRGSRTMLAHRAAYELAVGPIPAGYRILHTCDNPPCVNPAHLWVGTQLDNIADRQAKGRGRERATVCVNGHAYTEPSRGGHHNRCRVCKRANERARRARKVEAAA